MSIGKALGRVGIILAIAAMAAIGQTKSVESVKIGNLTWTKQNINIKTPNSWCYDNDESNCAKYGRLYTRDAAEKACASMGGKWRLPTEEDWDNLMKAIGEVRDTGHYNYANAGRKLKSKSGWNRCRVDDGGVERCVENGNGTDDYGFSAMPGGDYNHYVGSDSHHSRFNNVGNYGYWWNATDYGGGKVCYRYMGYDFDHLDGCHLGHGTVCAFSVRCVAQN